MKVSYNWLKNYIDIDIEAAKLAQILTDCGLEVEGLEKIQTVKGGLEGLVVGEILTKEKHPDADRLNLTTVNIGNGEPLKVVCGAPNVDIGQKVVVATVGTTLYSGDESFKIKKSKIRGQLSEGMICAEDEIGLGESHDGIMVLETNAKVGMPAKDYFKIEDDFVFEIGLTPNRADATGHIGFARDIVAVLNQTQNYSLSKPSVESFKVENTKGTIEVNIFNDDLCPRYTGVTITNIKVKESPDWLKNRLLAIGLTPINNVVDVTNFVLHETGQPLHAFDLEKIEGNKIEVKTLPENTKFITLDDVERKLSAKDLMICNAKTPMCIAGVFGGIESGVSANTTSIFLESAYFNPVSIRKSAKRHGLNTDASFRFERGTDPNNTVYALKRAALLIKEIAGGVISSDIFDYYPKEVEDFKVTLTYENCDKLIGKTIDRNLIKNILTSLDIKIEKETTETLELTIPPFKVDVTREVDVIEEILRVYGYNNIEIPQVLSSSLSYRSKPDKEKITNIIAELLIANGFNEMLSNSLTKSDYYEAKKGKSVYMKNPLSKDLNVLRQSMLYGGLEIILYNQNRKSQDLRLFELGSTYTKNGDKFKEQHHLSIFLTGTFNLENWNTRSEETNFYDLKGIVNTIIEKFGLNKMLLEAQETTSEVLAYGIDYLINKNKLVTFGKVDNSIQTNFDIDKPVFYADFDFSTLIKLIGQSKVIYKEVSKFPLMRRDLALLLDKEITYAQIKSLALKQDKKLLKTMNLFDVYEGKNLPEGKKSYGVSFIFSDENKTLTDNQVDKIMDKIIKSLKDNFDAELR